MGAFQHVCKSLLTPTPEIVYQWVMAKGLITTAASLEMVMASYFVPVLSYLVVLRLSTALNRV